MHGYRLQGIDLLQITPLELKRYVSSFEAGAIGLNDLIAQIKMTICQLECYLFSLPYFIETLTTAKQFTPQKRRPVFFWTFSESAIHRFSLLGIHKHVSIPLHDHPGMISIAYVLYGQIHTQQYILLSTTQNLLFAELERRKEQSLNVGEFTVAMQEMGNLHNLRALSRNAVCLNLQIVTYADKRARSWYFPDTRQQRDDTLSLCYIVQNRELLDAI
jgi:hypothetical protein